MTWLTPDSDNTIFFFFQHLILLTCVFFLNNNMCTFLFIKLFLTPRVLYCKHQFNKIQLCFCLRKTQLLSLSPCFTIQLSFHRVQTWSLYAHTRGHILYFILFYFTILKTNYFEFIKQLSSIFKIVPTKT